MNILSRTIAGGIMVVGGLILNIIPFLGDEKGLFWIWTYGIPILIIGIFILFNKKEDEVEEIKKVKGGRKKK